MTPGDIGIQLLSMLRRNIGVENSVLFSKL